MVSHYTIGSCMPLLLGRSDEPCAAAFSCKCSDATGQRNLVQKQGF